MSEQPAWPRLHDVVLAMRPAQWTKNVVVLAAPFFAFGDPAQRLPLSVGLRVVLPAALLFCLVSSGIYILNDLRDIESDRNNELKRNRPIAAGRVPVPFAIAWCVVLLLTGAGGALLLSPPFAATIGVYVILQILYCFGLKHIALADIFVLAGGFVLRALAGAVAVGVKISPWLLFCTFLLALFLALCKRRHEKVLLRGKENRQRASLEMYDERLLDLLIAITSAATLIAYSIYTLAAETVEKFGTSYLGFTIPFVIFGLFRYLDLVYRHKKGDRPEKILLTDLPILICIGLYGTCVLVVFLVR